MLKFLTWVHSLLFQLVFWAVKLPFKTVWATVLTVLALLGEEVRRWAGLLVTGLLILLAGHATRAFAPAELREPLVLTVLLVAFIWALAVRRAAYWTAHNNLRSVRQRQWFRQLAGDVKDLRGRFMTGVASVARGTPLEGVFRGNREARTQAQADAQRAADQAAADQAAAAAEERRLEELIELEPDPYASQAPDPRSA